MRSVFPRALAAGLVLIVAGCGQITPLRPDALPQPSQLKSPFVLRAMRMRPPSGSGCPVGYTLFPEPGTYPGLCVRPAGSPVTITSAAVSAVSSFQPPPAPGQQAGPVQYRFMITLPSADVPALTTVSTIAADVKGPLSIEVSGRTWLLPVPGQPFTGRQLLIPMPSRNQALQLHRLLVPSG